MQTLLFDGMFLVSVLPIVVVQSTAMVNVSNGYGVLALLSYSVSMGLIVAGLNLSSVD